MPAGGLADRKALPGSSAAAPVRGFALTRLRPLPGMLGEALIILGDLKHHVPRHGVAILLCNQASCVGAAVPVVGVIEHTAVRPPHVFTKLGADRVRARLFRIARAPQRGPPFAGSSGEFLTTSPPAEQTTARQD
jgi:hypothetical protein